MADYKKTSRRNFLGGLAGAAALGLSYATGNAQTASRAQKLEELRMPMVQLGRKQKNVSRFCLGGWHAGLAVKEETSLAMMQRAFELGVNFYDSAYSYGRNGESELRLGKAFSARRDDVVLMSKSYQRTAKQSLSEFDKSLERMGTARLDLWQFHSLNSPSDVDEILKVGGAMETAREGTATGKIGMLGATSHNSPEALIAAMDRIPELEVIQCPVNCLDPHWKSFGEKVIPMAREKNISVLAMKTLGLGNITQLPDISVEEALRYALSQPITSWVSGVESMEQLESNLRLVMDPQVMTAQQQQELVARTEKYKGERNEPYKSW